MGEEFLQVVRLGSITAAWEVFHQRNKVWLPMALHPLFRKLDAPDGGALLADLGHEPGR
jgi:hypothetical protein